MQQLGPEEPESDKVGYQNMKPRVVLLAAVALAVHSALALAQSRRCESSDSSFTVGDIKVEGLQRISEGTVFNYLPVNIGDHLTPQRVREAIRALYATGFFRDVELRRDGNTLIVVVLERPSIESFDITGNKDIKTEDLQKSLRNVGLAAGKTFDRSVLDDVTQYLTDQYYSRGKYGVRDRHQGRRGYRTTASRSRSRSRKATARRSARSTSSATPRSRQKDILRDASS